MSFDTRELTAAPNFAGDSPGYPGNLRSYWHPIALANEVVDEPKRFMLLDEAVVLYRVDGEVVAFKDLCIHRGTALSLGSRTPDGNLQCAYHGWEYDKSGACVRIPAKADGTPIPGKARAIKYDVEERYGVVWVALEKPLYPLPPFPNNEYEDPDWLTFFLFSQTWDTSAGRIMENFGDWAHVPFVHDGVLGSVERPRPEKDPTEIWERETEFGYSLGYSYEQIDTSKIYGEGGKISIRREYVVNIPFWSHLYKINPDGQVSLFSLVVAPITPKRSTLYLWMSRNHSKEEPEDTFRSHSELVFQQDKRIVESQRPEEIPIELKEELHIKVPDAFSVEYRRVLQRIAEISPFLP